MTRRSFNRILTVCAAAASLALPASLASASESARGQPAAQAAASKPLKLKKFMRKPIATSATRTVKKKNGNYAKVGIKRHEKPRAAKSQVSPENLSPAAAQAFASYELARVRVVTPEEIGIVDLQTNPAATTVGIDSVQVVSADEVNDIDRKADSPSAVSLDALSRDLAGSGLRDFAAVVEPTAASNSWFQRMMTALGGAFAVVATLVRALLG